MGLDTVELVMSVENWFEIAIPDAVAEKLFTVGDLHAFVVDELTRVCRFGGDCALVYEQLQRQAMMLSFVDNFRLMGTICLCVLPLLFVMKQRSR